MLCSICSSIFVGVDVANLAYLDDEETTPIAYDQPSSDIALQLRKNKCYICNRLSKACEAGSEKQERDFHIEYYFRRLQETGNYCLIFRFSSIKWIEPCCFYLTQVNPSAIVDLPRYISEDGMPSTTDHEQVFAWVKACLDTCVQHHNCGCHADPNWLPPRLLDIENGAIKLVDSMNLEPVTRYATLSYCWGIDPSSFVLTADNVEELRVAVPLEELPKTFQDVIVVTRALGISFLWIDSLCILQAGEGSLQDWQEHVLLMAEIYTNCAVNIAADFGASARDGLFVSRDPKFVKHLIIEFSSGTYQLYHSDNIFAVEESLLSTRGWVFQERMLSERSIHYGKEQVFWECREETRFESLLSAKIDTVGGFLDGLDTLLPNADAVTENHLDKKAAYFLWTELVEQYSRRRLTKPDEDKLVAIGGVAKRMAIVLKDEYVAGLFSRDLVNGLLWLIDDPNFPERKGVRSSGPYRAPSWSWASINGAVHFRYYPEIQKIFATILEHKVDLAYSGNPYGQLTGASLVIRAPYFGCIWQVSSGERPVPMMYTLDGLQVGPRDELWKDVRMEFYFDIEDPSLEGIKNTSFLFIAKRYRVGIKYEGLVLVKSEGEENTWTRLGTFCFEGLTDNGLRALEICENVRFHADVHII